MNSINSVISWDVKIYPNPASNELYLKTQNEKENLKISIDDVNGRRIDDYSVNINGYLGNIKLDLSSGIYFLSLSNSNGDKIIKKLVITK